MAGLRYETGRDMPPGMLEKVAVKLAADLSAEAEAKQEMRMMYLAIADQEGRVVVLPCKIGDTIYAIPSKANRDLNRLSGRDNDNRVYQQVVDYIQYYKDDVYLVICFGGLQSHHSKHFGETWFLTREEAEAKLREDSL